MPEIPIAVIQALVAILAVVVLLLAVFRAQRRRRRRAGDEAGSPLPDYNRVLAELRRHEAARAPHPSPQAVAKPGDDFGARRERKQRRIELRALSEGERRAYFSAWQRLQTQAGPVPKVAVERGLKLADDVLRARGFFGDQAPDRVPSSALPSPEAAAVMTDYGRVREIAELSERGAATAEELRQARLILQALFRHLLTVGTAPEEPRRYAAG